VQLNHYIERHPDDSQHFCKKIEIMFQTENAKCDTLKIYSGNAKIDLTYSPTKFIGFFLEKKKIVSENELQLVRQDHTYELWDIRYIKLIKDPKINSNIVDDIELYIV
jgi:hypothetical protein